MKSNFKWSGAQIWAAIVVVSVIIGLLGSSITIFVFLKPSGSQTSSNLTPTFTTSQPGTGNTPTVTTPQIPSPTATPTDTPPPLPTPTPLPQPGTILFQGSSNNWSRWLLSDHWYIQNNQLLNDGNGTPPLIAPYYPGSPDYAVEAKITKIKSTDSFEDSFGLVVRGTSDNGGYTLSLCFANHYAFGTSSGCADKEYYEALLLVGQNFPEGGMAQYFAFKPTLNKEYTYRIEVKGDTISAFIDGHQLFPPVTDLTYKDAGQISIWSSHCQIIVSSFTVISL